MLNGYELVAVADDDEEKAAKGGGDYGCRAYSDYRELLSASDIDLVVVATPTRLHAEMTLEAVAAGKHVVVEKPFATSSAEARTMFDAGREGGVFVGGFHNRRFDSDVLAVRKVIRSGRLGTLLHTGIRLHSYVRRSDWQTLRAQGGGALSNWGAHILDWCIYLFGTDLEVVHVGLVHALNPGDAEDGFQLHMRCPEGSMVTVEYFSCAALGLPRWHVVGQTGSAICDSKSLKVRYCDPARLVPIHSDSGASDGSYGLKEDLGWDEVVTKVEYRENSIPYYEMLARHLGAGEPEPVTEKEVLWLMKTLEMLRKAPLRTLDHCPSAALNGQGVRSNPVMSAFA